MANFREYTSAADYCAIMDGDSMNPVFLPGDELFIRAQGFTEADAGRVMAFNVEGELYSSATPTSARTGFCGRLRPIRSMSRWLSPRSRCWASW